VPLEEAEADDDAEGVRVDAAALAVALAEALEVALEVELGVALPVALEVAVAVALAVALAVELAVLEPTPRSSWMHWTWRCWSCCLLQSRSR
jgi:hypothetical protein